ncbi:MAG: hypothetical protein U5K71_10505 [Gracilimonas sp.]|nr:hypothetical protein [Gracilimonas sp.]
MKTSILTLFLFSLSLTLYAQPANDENALTDLLNEFLEGASYNDPEIHDRFWAEDLIYTGSAGNRTVKFPQVNELDMTDPADYGPEPRK